MAANASARTLCSCRCESVSAEKPQKPGVLGPRCCAVPRAWRVRVCRLHDCAVHAQLGGGARATHPLPLSRGRRKAPQVVQCACWCAGQHESGDARPRVEQQHTVETGGGVSVATKQPQIVARIGPRCAIVACARLIGCRSSSPGSVHTNVRWCACTAHPRPSTSSRSETPQVVQLLCACGAGSAVKTHSKRTASADCKLEMCP